MTSQSWLSLVNKKYQLSLRLFLFLNAASALFSVTNPLYSVRVLSVPLFAVLTISTGLLIWHWKNSTRKINIPVVSAIFGLLWAWQIVSKFLLITHDHATYLMMALLTGLWRSQVILKPLRYIHFPLLYPACGLVRPKTG